MRFHRYDQVGLDAQYNMRERVPSFPEFVSRWAVESERVRRSDGARLDLSYGDHSAERLDLFVSGKRQAPLHVFIHGGYWQAMDKEHFAFVANGLLPHGFSVATLEYALAPAVSVSEIVRQCRTALAWLWRHADAYGFDADTITVSGHSAGGHLTAMLLLTKWPEFEAGLPARVVNGGLAISGLYDLEPIRLSYLNQALKLDAPMTRQLSPIHLLDHAQPPPLVAAVGGDETEEFHRQQQDFLHAWTSRGFHADQIDMPGTNHFSIVDTMGDPDGALVASIRRLAAGGETGTTA